MKTKNMRKKALLSSVAMLLVAVVALGGATYAWFTTNTRATANGVQLSTGAETSIWLNLDKNATAAAEGWQESITLTDVEGNLTPCSSDDAATFYSINGMTAPTGSETNVPENYHVTAFSQTGTSETYEFAIKSGKNANICVNSITGTNSNAAIQSALRFCVEVTKSGQAPQKFIYRLGSGTVYALDSVNSSTYVAGSAKYQDLYGGTAIEGINYTNMTDEFKTLGTTQIVTLGTNEVATIKLTIWLEGNDPACDNFAMGQTFTDFAIEFGVLA
jgi:hypothetical protein